MNALRLFCVVIYALLLAACATVPLEPVVRAPAFEMTGRIAVRYQNHAFSSVVRWSHNGESDDIYLAAPLGQTVARLQADTKGATLTDAEQHSYHAASIESLTQSALGWRLPVSDIGFWVRGQAEPGTAAPELDDQHRAARLNQGTWNVTFNYADAAAKRPMRIDVNGAGAEIHLVIDSLSPE